MAGESFAIFIQTVPNYPCMYSCSTGWDRAYTDYTPMNHRNEIINLRSSERWLRIFVSNTDFRLYHCALYFGVALTLQVPLHRSYSLVLQSLN